MEVAISHQERYRFFDTKRTFYYFSSFKNTSQSLRVFRMVGFVLSSLSALVPGLQFSYQGAKIRKLANFGSSEKLKVRLRVWFWKSSVQAERINDFNDGNFRRDLAKNLSLMSPPSLSSNWRSSSFVNSRGQTIFTQSWTPVDERNLKAIVIILHGLNEHSGRYAYFASQLNSHGYGAFAMDWIGHGGSDGLHGYVDSLDNVVLDVKEFEKIVTARYPSLPYFIFGHSTGGAIALKMVSSANELHNAGGLILTSPAIRVSPGSAVVAALAPIFSSIIPKYQFSGATKSGNAVSRDPLALVTKYSDPLVYTGALRVRTGNEILRITSYLQKNFKRVRTPFLVLHGSSDRVTDPNGSRELYEKAAAKHKDITLYEGLLHDLLFEPEKDSVTQDIISWMHRRLEQRRTETA